MRWGVMKEEVYRLGSFPRIRGRRGPRLVVASSSVPWLDRHIWEPVDQKGRLDGTLTDEGGRQDHLRELGGGLGMREG